MDIVIPTIRDLDFLEDWRNQFEDHHLIIVQDGNPKRDISVPSGFSYDLYNRNDIKKDLGDDHWIISFKDSACRCYGFLKATSKYVYTIDDDCFPPSESDCEPALEQHKKNLESPSHPNYFNTLYDQEFVRGYPFSRRQGVDTAISHGLWLHIPDFDAPTQMVRPNHRNTERVDIVQTIPSGVLYPMCGMNLAFDRELIGMSMYFGLMGESQPWGRYDDMWAGWCTKVICDYLGYGVKTGKPYIRHEKASSWKSNLKKEMKGILWQDKILDFFESIDFPNHCSDVKDCYLYLGKEVEEKLEDVDEYFAQLGKAMQIWVKVWERHES